MSRRPRIAVALAILLSVATSDGTRKARAAVTAPADTDLGQPTWSLPTRSSIDQQVAAWLDRVHAAEGSRGEIRQLWARPAADSLDNLLDTLAGTCAAVDPEARRLVTYCSAPHRKGALPDFAFLAGKDLPPFEARHLRLYYGRYLAREKLYDEARAQLEGLEVNDVLDPASLLFYRGVVHHHFLDQDAGLAALGQLLEQKSKLPRRYAELAELMQSDLAALQEDSLDHISRRMDDIERRLDLGHAGPKVRKVEDGVIESLDKLIKKIEDQQQSASSASPSGGGGSPASDSRIMEGKAPGHVAPKDIGNKSGWGDLPPKERQEAMQQVGKEFPAHYRDVVEQYLRKLAGQEEAEKEKN